MKRLLKFDGFKLNEKANTIKKLIEDLKLGNPHWPKIPVANVFKNPNAYDSMSFDEIREVLKGSKDYIADDKFDTLPVEDIDVDKLVPTQKVLRAENLERVEDSLTDDVLKSTVIKYNDLYYIIDGHHRIAMRILLGEETIPSHVYTNKNK